MIQMLIQNDEARPPTVRDRARQQKVNFLMFDLVTGLPAFILLLGLFCGRECRISRTDRRQARQNTWSGAGGGEGRGWMSLGYLVEGRVHCPQLRQPAVGHVTHRVCGGEHGHGLE